MHELAIADNIIQAVLTELKRNGWQSVSSVALRIGALSDVVPESLEFGFQVLTRDTPLSATTLSIERVPASGQCRACRHEFEVADFVFVCPRCRCHDVELTHGLELDIAYLEVEDTVSV